MEKNSTKYRLKKYRRRFHRLMDTMKPDAKTLDMESVDNFLRSTRNTRGLENEREALKRRAMDLRLLGIPLVVRRKGFDAPYVYAPYIPIYRSPKIPKKEFK